jgi:glucosamine-6-phosphate deaminase
MNRKEEVRALLALSPKEVISRAADRLVVCDTIDDLHRRFAREVADEIAGNNAVGKDTRLIVPVGPTGQYPILARIIAEEGIDCSRTWLFFMDEYADEAGHAVPEDHPLSFKGEADRLFFSQLRKSSASSAPPAERVFFPDETNVGTLAGRIFEAGGIDTCYGGIGIHGHVAFNEPEPGVATMGARLVQLNAFTLTINAVRSHVGGNLACYPDTAFTLGMREILASRRIRLYCRNGTDFDWANTVLRLALFGEPGDDYPVTHIRNHDYTIVTDRDTLESPAVQL